jgi:hypothetical protein
MEIYHASTGKTIYYEFQLVPNGAHYYVYGIKLKPIEKDEIKSFIRSEGDPVHISFTNANHEE